MTKRLQDAALDFQECAASRPTACAGVRRLAGFRPATPTWTRCGSTCAWRVRWEWLSAGQYQHAAAHGERDGRAAGRLDQTVHGTSGRLARRGALCAGAGRKSAAWCVAARSTTMRGTRAAPTATGTIRTTVTRTTGFGSGLLTTFQRLPEMRGRYGRLPGRGLKAGAVRPWPRPTPPGVGPGE